MQQIQKVSKKAVLRYMILPGVIPRLRAFAENGFGWLALMMALVYQTARLLPENHPYTNPDNLGKFGIRHVIAEAANNLEFKREKLDQIIIFAALLAGLVLLALQCALLMVSLVLKAALATNPFGGMFNTVDPERDIALSLLARVFGVPGLFCSADGANCTEVEPTLPTPFHEGLHGLFQFYSFAILLVGVLILMYYVVLLVGETAQTGTPFGRRFAHIWVPVRLVVAVGLLVPINYGLNSGQYMALFAARLGSGFATNTWNLFNRELTNATGLEDASLIARAHTPDTQHILKFMALVHSCRAGYEQAFANSDTPMTIEAYFIKEGAAAELLPIGDVAAWEAGNTYYENDDIIIRFGHLDPVAYPNETSGVKPYCGEIIIHRVDPTQEGVRRIGTGYTGTVNFLWGRSGGDVREFGIRATEIWLPYEPKECSNPDFPASREDNGMLIGTPVPCDQLPGFDFKQQEITQAQTFFENRVELGYNLMRSDTDFTVPEELLARGWGGAGIWYNRIAQWNGAFISAVRNVPTPSKMPWPMEQVQEARRGSVGASNDENRYSPMVDGDPVVFEKDEEWYIADMLNKVYNYWQLDAGVEPTDTRHNNNLFVTAINMAFGLDGLFTIRENHDVHPLAQLVAIGKGIVDSSVRNLVAGIGLSAAAGGMEGLMGPGAIAGILQGLGSMFLSFVTIGLAVGFILFYILPFMPFMYFFFAVGGWMKSIFEAMVGIPLWALAHLRVDGNGLPGDSASNGYFLILEIFLRPVLIVFGLLASLAIFTAMARVLHEIFPLVTQNLTGFDGVEEADVQPLLYGEVYAAAGIEFKREPIDEFFFTIVYTIIVYIMATSSFKLIDQIPNSILRWMGAGVKTFNDNREDPVGNLTQYAAYGGMNMTGQVTGAMSEAAHGVGKATGEGIRGLLPDSSLTARLFGGRGGR